MTMLQKFKSADDAQQALWMDSRDTVRLAARIRSLWSFSARLCPSMIPRGLRKFRSIEEAQEERERWIQARVDFIRRTRKSKH
jgi:hypothetical protein